MLERVFKVESNIIRVGGRSKLDIISVKKRELEESEASYGTGMYRVGLQNAFAPRSVASDLMQSQNSTVHNTVFSNDVLE